MSTVLVNALKEAMSLTPEDRFILAHELFESLGFDEEPITLDEIDRRLSEIRNGVAVTVTMDELEASMQEALNGAASSHP